MGSDSFLEKVYKSSPIFFQNLMTTVKGYQLNMSRYGKHYYEYREFLEKFDNFTYEDKLKYQTDELLSFIKYVNKNSSFYNELYKGIDVNGFNCIEDIKKLPIVDKEMIRENLNNLVTIDEKNAIVAYTGGTTGKSLKVLMTKSDMMERMAILDHFKSRIGFEHRKMKRATFNGRHIVPLKQKSKVFWRYNKACKQMIYSSFHLSEENLGYYVDSFNKFKPDSIDGFFSSILDLASYIKRHDIKLAFRPIAVFPTSETLTEEGRKLIEEVFETKVYDQYASSEGAPFITECEKQVAHMEMATGYIENINETSSEVLVTSFTTHGTPLIRYRIGDSIEFSDANACDCGNESIIIKNIEGRALDFLYADNGSKINAGNIANVFKYISNAIIKAQIVQDKIGEVIVNIVIDERLYKDNFDDLIKNELTKKLGLGTNIIVNHVQDIEREKSGKFKFVKNNVNLTNKIKL